MEAKVATLEVRVDVLEKRLEDHDNDDRQIHKYMTNMMEDLQARLAGIEKTGARFEADMMHRNGHDTTTQTRLDSISERLRVLERMAWVAIGGLGALGTVATFFGWQVLKLLGK